METSDTFFFYDGSTVVGPHSGKEISEMHAAGMLKPESQICTANDHGWKSLKDFPELLKNVVAHKPRKLMPKEGSEVADQTVKSVAGKVADTDEPADDEDEDIDSGGKFTPIRKIRSLLNSLWEAQRESIIATIRNEELDDKYEHKRKEHVQIKTDVRDLALEYWRRSRVLVEWIRDLTWEDGEERGDYRKKLTPGQTDANFEKVMEWLENAGLAELAGCYAFKKGKDYIYIGMTEGTLKDRLKQHQDKIYWSDATHIRIVIPKHKSKTSRLERLLILQHQPDRNRNEGNSSGGSQADDCLELITKEINELLTDG